MKLEGQNSDPFELVNQIFKKFESENIKSNDIKANRY